MASEILCDLIQPLLLDPTSTSKLLFHVFPSSSIPKLLHVCVLSHFSRVWLFLTPWIVAHQAPLSMRIPQARILEWLAISLSAEPSSCMCYAFCLKCLSLIFFYHSLFFYFLFFYLFVVSVVIHWNETAMGLHGFPILIPPPTSLSTCSL